MTSRRSAALLAVVTCLVAGCRRSAPDPALVAEWMHTLYGVVRAERLTPPVASRFLAYASVALHEGFAAATPGMPSLGGVLNGLADLPAPDPSADAALVALAAEAVLLDSMLVEGLPTTRATVAGLVDSIASVRRTAGVGPEVEAASLRLGQAIGLAVVRWSRADGFDTTRSMSYTPPSGPQFWVNDSTASLYAARNLSGVSQAVAVDNPTNELRPTDAADRNLILNRPKASGNASLPAVDMAGATEPYWGSLRPFLLQTWNECGLPPPPEYSADTASALYRESVELIEVQKALTPEHRTVAFYWADNPGETATPAGHWTAIAAQMVTERRLDLRDAARLFVLTAAAQADAFIAAWGYKYQYSQIRPRTYIRRHIDPDWEPMIPTPPFPEYPSGHSTQSAAAAAVIEATIGSAPFADSSGLAIGHGVRRFGSLDEAAEEAGWSRIYGGIHFHSGKTGGKALGECIGRRAADRIAAATASR